MVPQTTYQRQTQTVMRTVTKRVAKVQTRQQTYTVNVPQTQTRTETYDVQYRSPVQRATRIHRPSSCHDAGRTVLRGVSAGD